jgi:phosphomannomutase
MSTKIGSAVVKRKALLKDSFGGESAGGCVMRCACGTSLDVCTLHNVSALQRRGMAMALRQAIAASSVVEWPGTLQ